MADNASSNDTFIEHLSELNSEFLGSPARVRCFNHILNLVAKMMMRWFRRSGQDVDNSTAPASDHVNDYSDMPGLIYDEDEEEEDDDGDENEASNVEAGDVRPIADMLQKARLNF